MAYINSIIDLYHGDTLSDVTALKPAGIAGVIHKSTEGLTTVDPLYLQRRQQVKAQGLLWGCYHFGLSENIEAQVQHFLNQANPSADELVCLDWEPSSDGPVMTITDVEQFVGLVKDQLGRWPVLYSGNYFFTQQLASVSKSSPIFNCRLWLASYTSAAPALPSGFSGAYLWQYTDGAKGNLPHTVPGVDHCDRDIFVGDSGALAGWWVGN